MSCRKKEEVCFSALGDRYGALPNETAFPLRIYDSWILNQGYFMQAGLKGSV